MRIILFFLMLLFISCENANHDMPNLLDIFAFESTKGRIQDMKHLPDPVVDQLISNGKSSIPYLISRLKSKEVASNFGVIELWPYVEERHLAILILNDFFIDSSWEKTTLPENMHLENLIELRKYPDLAIWNVFYEYVDDEKWDLIINKWESLWEQNKKLIFWDDDEKFFKIKGAVLNACKNN